MNHDLIKRIKEWRSIAEKQEDFFVNFALEYFAFNGLIRITYPEINSVKNRDLIKKLKRYERCKAEFLRNNKNLINELKRELDRKTLQNLTKNTELKIENQEDWNNIVDSVKYPEDERDQKLVKIGYYLLPVFNDYFNSKKEGESNA